VSEPREGPVERSPWPERLDAHVVTPGPRPRVHGYDVEGELAAGGSAAEMALLASTGELPSRAARAAAEIALQFAAAVSVAEAPVHAAVLGRLTGAGPSGLVAIAATGLAEQARAAVEALGDWPARLGGDPSAPPPASALAGDDDERASTARLAAAIGAAGLPVPALAAGVGRDAAIVAVLVACGVREPAALVGLLVAARLPIAVAEALAVRPTDFRSYPMDTPPFAYEAPR
jgi:hypothetical protein